MELTSAWGDTSSGWPRLKSDSLRRQRDAAPAVSIIIATRDEEPAVHARVEDCLRIIYSGSLEVIVALDARYGVSVPEDYLLSDSRVRAVTGDDPGGKAATLNAGVRAATGKVLVFTDTHQRFDAGAITVLVDALQMDARLGAVSGNLELDEHGQGPFLLALYWRFERWLRHSEARVHSAVGVTGAIYAVQKSLWRPLPPELLLDDVYTPMRLVLEGHRVGFSEKARAHETRAVSPGGEYRRKVRTLTGVIQLCLFMPSVLVPRRNPIWAQFLFHKLLRLLTPYLLAVIVAWSIIAGAVALNGYLPAAAAVLAALLLWVSTSRSRFSSAVREAVTAGVLMQSAIVVATVNGLRRRWSVWRT